MHAYRTHTCGALRRADAGQTARLSGWVHRKRDHGQLLFVDLRDHYGVTQCVIDIASPLFKAADALRLESVVTLTGKVVERSAETVNPKLATGEVELQIAELALVSEAEPLPFPVNTEADYPEEMRLKYRFLDLRRETVHANIMLRSAVIASHSPAHDRAGLHRVPDPDPDRVLARGRARLSRAEPASIPASSTRCRRRRSSSSSC